MASAQTMLHPCTCDSHSGTPGINRRSSDRASSIAGERGEKSISLPPTPWRVVEKACTFVGAGQSGTIQSTYALASREAIPVSTTCTGFPRAEHAQQVGKIARQRRFPVHRFLRHGMRKSKPPSVQRLTRECDVGTSAIRRVADQRMVQRREMDANLVSAAGFEPTDKQRAIAEALAHRVAGERRLAAANNGHRCTFGRMPADRRVDNATANDVAN